MFEFERITYLDFLLTPFLGAFIYLIAKRYRDRHFSPYHPYRIYFLPALLFKMVGAVSICLIYTYYYKGGDTVNYFYHSQVVNHAMSESPAKWLNLLLGLPDRFDPEYFEYTRLMEWYGKESTYKVVQFTSIFSLLTFNSFIPTALLFAVMAFTGMWALFVTFANLYPTLREPIATATLFIPSVALWGSGIFKDTLCMFALGWLCYATLEFFINKNRSTKNLIFLAASFWLLSIVKIYIIICFVPALAGWVIFQNTSRIKNKSFAVIVNLIGISAAVIAFFFLFGKFSESLGRYSLDEIQKTSETTRRWISYVSQKESGSLYGLGIFDPSFTGMLTKFPQAVNVTLFRPYLWESSKPIIFFNAIESFIFLILTLKLIFSVGLKNIIQSITSNYTVQFTFIFSIIFAFAVGISSYNFGSLSRYKIPCIPFYLLTLILIFYQHARPGQRLWRKLRL